MRTTAYAKLELIEGVYCFIQSAWSCKLHILTLSCLKNPLYHICQFYDQNSEKEQALIHSMFEEKFGNLLGAMTY